MLSLFVLLFCFVLFAGLKVDQSIHCCGMISSGIMEMGKHIHSVLDVIVHCISVGSA